jgi:hypothetical protein
MKHLKCFSKLSGKGSLLNIIAMNDGGGYRDGDVAGCG